MIEAEIDYMEETTPLPVTEERFKTLKEALRAQKKRQGRLRFKKDICEKHKVTYMTLWRVEKARTYRQYQNARRK